MIHDRDCWLLILEKIRTVKNGSVSIIKQDDRIVQINVCEIIQGEETWVQRNCINSSQTP
jgi:hypothetical protein